MGARERFYLAVCRWGYDPVAAREAFEWIREHSEPYPWSPWQRFKNWTVWQSSIRAIRIQNEIVAKAKEDR